MIVQARFIAHCCKKDTHHKEPWDISAKGCYKDFPKIWAHNRSLGGMSKGAALCLESDTVSKQK